MKRINLLIGFMLLSLVSLAQYTGTFPVTLSGLPSGATSIQWYKDGVAISGANSATYNATIAGQYYAAYTDASTACTDDRTVLFVLLNASSSVTLTGSTNNSGGSSYQWYNQSTIVAGATSANYTATTGGLYSLRYNNGTCEVETQKYYVFMAEPLTASNPPAQTATVGQAKSGNASTDLAPTGGTSPYIYSNGTTDPACTAPSGATALPASSNLTVNASTGAYSYTAPSTAGTYYFCIKVCDSATPTASCVVKTYTVTVTAAASPLTASNPPVQTSTTSQATTGNAATDLAPTGGTSPYIYSNGSSDPACTPVSGATALPASSNLTVNASTGAYSYTAPSIAGTYYFCIKVCDSTTPTAQCVVKTYTVIVTASCNAGTAAPALIKN